MLWGNGCSEEVGEEVVGSGWEWFGGMIGYFVNGVGAGISIALCVWGGV